MKTLVMPELTDILKGFISHEGGNTDIEVAGETPDYILYRNKAVGAAYLVQTHRDYDLFGFNSFKAEFPVADVYFFVGPMFITAHFENIRKSFEEGKEWHVEVSDSTHKWASEMMLFREIGGIIYNHKTWSLVDKDVKE